MSASDRPLAEHVTPKVDQARLARQWARVSERLASRPRRRFAWAIAPAMVLVTIALLLVVKPWTPKAPVVASGAETITLPEGSRVALAPGSSLGVESATKDKVLLALASGAIDLDVTHVEGRSFVVRAGGHEVTVLGTLFSVRVDARALAVEVKRGRVRVTGPGGEHVLEAGQAWSTRIDGETAALAPPIDPAPATEPAASAAPVIDPSAVASLELPDTPSARAVVTTPVESAKDLLARATEARSAGRSRDAATALDTLRKKYRSDPRAGIAAYELGRVRLDALGDPGGAAEAFGDALALAPGAPFREDAEARRVEALDRAGDPRCAQAKASYATRFPSGLHAKQVEQRCNRR